MIEKLTAVAIWTEMQQASQNEFPKLPLTLGPAASKALIDNITYLMSEERTKGARAALLEEVAKMVEQIPHYTKHLVPVANVMCDVSTPPSAIAARIREMI